MTNLKCTGGMLPIKLCPINIKAWPLNVSIGQGLKTKIARTLITGFDDNTKTQSVVLVYPDVICTTNRNNIISMSVSKF